MQKAYQDHPDTLFCLYLAPIPASNGEIRIHGILLGTTAQYCAYFTNVPWRVMIRALKENSKPTGPAKPIWRYMIIEIKSPTEEQHLSLKAIRQALENKVILLSRGTHPTLPETTSLAVGYYLPNHRAEVTNLMSDFKTAFGYNIGIIDLKTLLTIAVTIVYDVYKKTS